uniref:DUF3575 domain-containing protein n=1 Tax=Roseihalotalea indica TaxID=2867963 RepID=A0AA49GKJ4_9BACT|nr:hypothetical protein K4G66_22100 [Tunicatimonas sp. TK19036]
MKKFGILFIAAILAYSTSLAQENPMRIGVKIGIPNISGLHLEYVTPALDGKLAPSLDLTYIPLSFQEGSDFTDGNGPVDFKFYYLELGANYYFFKPGKGLYGNLSYGRLGLNYDFTDYYSEEEDMGGGVGKLKAAFNLLNLKIGAKLGKSFYFRPEIGIALISANTDNFEYTITYPDGTSETYDEEDFPEILFGVSPVLNLGFGVAF